MAKYAFSVQTDTVDELYSSVAAFLATRPTVTATETGGLVTHVAPPIVTPSAPTPTEPTADADGPTNANPPEYDAAGIPWDERIHAGTKGMNQDGTWKRRRNTADVTYNIVMAELTQKTAGQAPSAPPVPASPGIVDQGSIPVPPAVVVPPPPMVAAPVASAVPVPPAPAVPPVQPAAPAPVAPVAAPVTDAAGMPFGVFMAKISAAMNAGKFDNGYLNSCLAQWEITNITQLQADAVKTQAFYDWLKSAGLLD